MYMFVFEVFTVYIICSHATCKGEGVFLTRVVPSSLRCASLCAYTTRCGSYTWDAATRSCHLHTQGDTETETIPHAKYWKESQRMVYRDPQCEGNEVCVPVEAWTKFTRVASTAATTTTTTTTTTPSPPTTTTTPSQTTTTTTPSQTTTTTTPSETTTTTTTTPSPTTTTTTPSPTATTTTQSHTTTTTTTTTTLSTTPFATTSTNMTTSPTTTTTTPSPTTATTTPSPTTTIPTTPSPSTTTTTPSPATTTTTPSPSTTTTTPSPTTTPPTTTSTTPCPVTVNQANVPYTYVGCYKDKSDHVLPYGYIIDRRCLTTETCKLHCHGMNYIYFGTRGGRECYCGDGIEDGYRKKPDSECNYTCPGDSSTMCGGHVRISIYKFA